MPNKQFDADDARQLTLNSTPAIVSNSVDRIIEEVKTAAKRGAHSLDIQLTSNEQNCEPEIQAILRERKFRLRTPSLQENSLRVTW